MSRPILFGSGFSALILAFRASAAAVAAVLELEPELELELELLLVVVDGWVECILAAVFIWALPLQATVQLVANSSDKVHQM